MADCMQCHEHLEISEEWRFHDIDGVFCSECFVIVNNYRREFHADEVGAAE